RDPTGSLFILLSFRLLNNRSKEWYCAFSGSSNCSGCFNFRIKIITFEFRKEFHISKSLSNYMFNKKSIEQLMFEAGQTGEGTLKRSLSSINLVALGIGAIIGAGLFSLTG